jgi:hypothetical protein
VNTIIGDLVAPIGGLGTQIVEGSEGPAVEEGVQDVPDARLHAAFEFGVAVSKSHRPTGAVVTRLESIS